jgi:hypothetical protein
MVKLLILIERIASARVLVSNVALQGEGFEHLSCSYENMCLFSEWCLRIAAEGRVSVQVEWPGSLWVFYRYF